MAEITVPAPSMLILRRLDLLRPQQVNRSGWTGARKGIGLPGAQTWTATVEIDALATEDDERPWRAFLFGLDGTNNWFRMPLGCQAVDDDPTVGSGSATPISIPVTGMPASATFLPAGSWLTITLPSGKFRPVSLTAALVANSSGNGTATFAPELTETPASGAAIYAQEPFLPLALSDPRTSISWTDSVAGITLETEEA